MMVAPLHIHLLGDFRLVHGEKLVTSFGSGRLQSLLAYLLLHREAPQSRQYVAFRLWPDSTEKQALTNLRQLLHHLRSALPDADQYVHADTQTMQWRTDATVTLDVAEFESAIARAEDADDADVRPALEEAVGWYGGKLLPSCYEEWIEPERERLHQLHITALSRLIDLQEEHRAYRAAIENAHRLLQQDDLREETYRALMRLHAIDGNRANALKVYEQCEEVLDRELGIAPAPSTHEVYERIRNASYTAQTQGDDDERDAHARLPLVGRHEEWQRMLAAWERVLEGNAQFLFVDGEAGIGKTRLAEELLTWAGNQGVTTARSHCHAAEGRIAYAPVTEWLKSEGIRAALQTLEPIWRTEVARILPEILVDHPELSPPDPMERSWQRQRFFEALTRAVFATEQPLLLLIDDVQWCDRSTLEWLHYLLRFDSEAKLLIVGTVRTGVVENDHPLEKLRLELRRSGHASEIHLGPLNTDETAQLAIEVASRELEVDRARSLHRETQGNPFYLIEHLRAGWADASRSSQQSDQDLLQQPFQPVALPPRMHAVITARLSQASSLAREVIALAAVNGRAFTFQLLVEASEHGEYELMQAIEELGHRQIIVERDDGTYDFSHDKLREVAYDRVSQVRRRFLHRRLARALKVLHDRDLDSVQGQIAAHYDGAGRYDQAIQHYQQAAKISRGVYADNEALVFLNRALKLLSQLPEGRTRDERELSLLMALGPSVVRVEGYAAPEMGDTYSRARELCQQLGETEQLPAVLWGLWVYRTVRVELKRAYNLGSQLLDLSRRKGEAALQVAGNFTLGCTSFHLGKFEDAREHLESAIDAYDRQQHQQHIRSFGPDHSVFAFSYLAHTLWHLGYPEQALVASRKARSRSRELSHPFSEAIALDYSAMLHQFRGEPEATGKHAEAAVELCRKHDFSYYLGWATFLKGWARARSHPEAAIEEMHEGLDALQQRGAALRRPYYLGLLAEAHCRQGEIEKGRALLDEAMSTMQESGEYWTAAEIHRLRGELVRADGGSDRDVRKHLSLSMEKAREQGAVSLALRAALSLAHLEKTQDGRVEYLSLVQALYDQFTEGLDTPDLKKAADLLGKTT